MALVLLFQFPPAFVGQMLVNVVFKVFMGFLSCGSFLCISFDKQLSIHKIKVYTQKSYLSSFLSFVVVVVVYCSCRHISSTMKNMLFSFFLGGGISSFELISFWDELCVDISKFI